MGDVSRAWRTIGSLALAVLLLTVYAPHAGADYDAGKRAWDAGKPAAALAGATAGVRGSEIPGPGFAKTRGAPAVPVTDATKGRFWCARTRAMFDIVLGLVQFHAYAMPVYSVKSSLGNLGPILGVDSGPKAAIMTSLEIPPI